MNNNENGNNQNQNTQRIDKVTNEDLNQRQQGQSYIEELERERELAKQANSSRNAKIIVAVIISVTVFLILLIVLINFIFNNMGKKPINKVENEVKQEEKITEIKETETPETKATEKATEATNNQVDYNINQRSMSEEQVNNWVNIVLKHRENNLENWNYLKEQPYGTSMTLGKQSSDRLVYVEVRQNAPDGTHDNLVTIFRINANGYLEELNRTTGEYQVIATVYGDVGKDLN